jgi:hypothetical protein
MVGFAFAARFAFGAIFSDLSARFRLRLVFIGISLSATREAPPARALGGIVSALPFSESSNGKLGRRDAKHSKYLAILLVALPTAMQEVKTIEEDLEWKSYDTESYLDPRITKKPLGSCIRIPICSSTLKFT